VVSHIMQGRLKFDTQSSISQIFLANSSMNSSICIGFLVEMEKSS